MCLSAVGNSPVTSLAIAGYPAIARDVTGLLPTALRHIGTGPVQGPVETT